MSEDFLTQFQKPPREEFSRDLYSRISGIGSPSGQPSLRWTPGRPLFFAARVLIVLVVLFAVLFAVSPAARAMVADAVRAVGDLMLNEAQEYPAGQSAALAPKTQTLDEARQNLPFDFALPAWAPAGFELDDTVQVVAPDGGLPAAQGDALSYVRLVWRKAGVKATIELQIQHEPGPAEWKTVVAPGSVEEVLVHGKPAALVHGAWNAETHQWDMPEFLDLTWKEAEVAYHLQTVEGVVPVEDLLRMAESIP